MHKVTGGPDGARFWRPSATVVHPFVTAIAVADTYNHQIRVVSLVTDEVRTVAGNGFPGVTDGVGTDAEFSEPSGLAFNADGSDLYVVNCDPPSCCL